MEPYLCRCGRAGRPSGRIRKPTKPKALKFHAARSPRHSMPQVVEFPHGLHEHMQRSIEPTS